MTPLPSSTLPSRSAGVAADPADRASRDPRVDARAEDRAGRGVLGSFLTPRLGAL